MKKIIDIYSKGDYPANVLSNFYPNEFVIDGVRCGGMEGFLQSLKFRRKGRQEAVAALSGKEAKEKIKANFPSAACCEMEGGSIGHVCYVNGTPFVVLRAISDKADGTGNMDYMQFCGIAAENSVKVMSEFIKRI